MPRLRDHGIGIGKKPPITSKIVKQQFSAVGAANYSAYNSTQVTQYTETKNYYWYDYNAGSYGVIIRVNKNDITDIKYYNRTTASATLYGMTGLYESDQIVLVVTTGYLQVINASMTLVSSQGLLNSSPSDVLGMYYVEATKILYIAYTTSASRIIAAFNLTTVTSMTTVYSVVMYNFSGNTSAAHTIFDPTTSTVRIIDGASINYKHSLTNGAYVSSNTGFGYEFSYHFALGVNYETGIFIDANGITKKNLVTNAVILQKTAATLKTELAPYLKDTSLTLDNIPSTFYVKKLPDGNYLGFYRATRSNGGMQGYVLAFVFDDNFQILKAEPARGMQFISSSFRRKQMHPTEAFFINPQNVEEPALYIF